MKEGEEMEEEVESQREKENHVGINEGGGTRGWGLCFWAGRECICMCTWDASVPVLRFKTW